MLPLLLLAAFAADVPAPSGLQAVSGLAGCWRVSGQVQGRDAPAIAKGEWHLGGRYFTLHLRALSREDPYEAAITYGAGQRPGEIGSLFSDTFGGLYEPSLGRGSRTDTGFEQSYTFPDSLYVNRFERQGAGWRWTIIEQVTGRENRVFADYRLTASSCRGMRFTY